MLCYRYAAGIIFQGRDGGEANLVHAKKLWPFPPISSGEGRLVHRNNGL